MALKHGTHDVKENLDRLFITYSKYNAHTDPIFRNNKLLKLNDIIKFHMCKFGYKLDRKIHPHPLLNIFKKKVCLDIDKLLII